jgi:hypothetical protein
VLVWNTGPGGVVIGAPGAGADVSGADVTGAGEPGEEDDRAVRRG